MNRAAPEPGEAGLATKKDSIAIWVV